ncbi:MAG: MOSC domain-containing protein [Opitutales bacterium]
MVISVDILAFYVSHGHDFRGRHGKDRENNPVSSEEIVECVTGQGIRGDRYFGFKKNYKAQVTFFDEAVHQAVRAEFGTSHTPDVYRRNVLLRGVDLNELIGKSFSLGEVEFEGVQECTPCYWMDEAVAPGTEDFLKGRGGLRTRVLKNGTLRLGEMNLRTPN